MRLTKWRRLIRQLIRAATGLRQEIRFARKRQPFEFPELDDPWRLAL